MVILQSVDLPAPDGDEIIIRNGWWFMNIDGLLSSIFDLERSKSQEILDACASRITSVF